MNTSQYYPCVAIFLNSDNQATESCLDVVFQTGGKTFTRGFEYVSVLRIPFSEFILPLCQR